MADLEERMKMFLNTISQDADMTTVCGGSGSGDTFAERAEWFFRKRPQLLGLLKDLYNAYITLMDRCNQIEKKHHFHQTSSLFSDQQQQEQEIIDTNWDTESFLSYYHQAPVSTIDDLESSLSFSELISSSSSGKSKAGFDEIVSKLVLKMVEEEILKQQMAEMEQQFQESWRKMDILKKLIEVTESERVVLLNENARLGYKVAELMEENQGLSSEAIFLRRKGAYLAKCVMKLREDHRVCVLTSRIENLQAQIHGLEKRNEEYYKQLMIKNKANPRKIEERRRMKNDFGLMGCFQMERIKFKKRNEGVVNNGDEEKSGRKWWYKVKKGMELQMFGRHGFSSPPCSSVS